MTFSVTMPALGESVTEGTVTRWLKSEGDVVAVDEPLLEVSTDKVDTEIPSPAAGVLQKIVVGPDQTVAVGTELAIISADGSAATPVAPPVAATPEPVAPPVTPVPPVAPVAAAPAANANGNGAVVTMPALGESVTEGTVTRWLKNVGDSIAIDEPLLEVSTDKVDTEIPSPVAGVITAIEVPADTTVAVGARLAVIGVSGSAPAPAAPAPTPTPVAPVAPPVTPAAPVTPVAPVVSAPASVTQPADAYVTPIVRKLASELGVNLANVKGTGVGGRIRKEDIEAAARPAAPAAVTTSSPAASSTSTAQKNSSCCISTSWHNCSDVSFA